MKKQYQVPTTESLEPTWTTDKERQAELTLLSQTLHLTGDQLKKFLEEYDIPTAEYERLCSKWARVISAYHNDKEKSNV